MKNLQEINWNFVFKGCTYIFLLAAIFIFIIIPALIINSSWWVVFIIVSIFVWILRQFITPRILAFFFLFLGIIIVEYGFVLQHNLSLLYFHTVPELYNQSERYFEETSDSWGAIRMFVLNYLDEISSGDSIQNIRAALIQDFYANVSSELISIGLTVLIIDSLNRRRDDHERRELLSKIDSLSQQIEQIKLYS